MNRAVLVADDDSGVRETLRLTLGPSVTVYEAEDGRSAVEAARAHRPGLVLLDINMPELGGLAALGEIRALDPAPEVIMLTSERDVSVARRALELGASAFVTKPFEPAFIRAEVRRAFAWGALQGDLEAPPWRGP